MSLLGIGFYAFDQVSGELEPQYPSIHQAVEFLELGGMTMGLGVGAWLFVEKLGALRARSVRRLEEERERRLHILGRMAASVAHEVRNPLQTMRLIVDEQWIVGQRPEEHHLRAEFEACFERINRAVELVYRLARPSSGEKATTELSSAAQDSIRTLERLTPGRVRFQWDRLPPSAIVSTSQSDVRIVLDNLLRNAAEASRPGGLVSLDLFADEGDWGLRIRNEGGLGTNAKGSGLGLGLAISRQIVSNVRGSIDIAEAEDHVLCTLRLPRDTESV